MKSLDSKKGEKLPLINQSRNDIKISSFIKAKEKVQELGIIVPKENQ